MLLYCFGLYLLHLQREAGLHLIIYFLIFKKYILCYFSKISVPPIKRQRKVTGINWCKKKVF